MLLRMLVSDRQGFGGISFRTEYILSTQRPQAPLLINVAYLKHVVLVRPRRYGRDASFFSMRSRDTSNVVG